MNILMLQFSSGSCYFLISSPSSRFKYSFQHTFPNTSNAKTKFSQLKNYGQDYNFEYVKHYALRLLEAKN